MSELPHYRPDTMADVCEKNQLLTLQFCMEHYAFFKDFTHSCLRRKSHDPAEVKAILEDIGSFRPEGGEAIGKFLDIYNLHNYEKSLLACAHYLTVEKNMHNERRKAAITSLVEDISHEKGSYQRFQLLAELFTHLVEVICYYFAHNYILQKHDKEDIKKVSVNDLREYFHDAFKKKTSFEKLFTYSDPAPDLF